MEVKVNLLDIKVEMNDHEGDVIELTKKIKVKLKYPEFSVIKRVEKKTDISDLALTLIADSIDWIHDGEQYYYAKECSPGELVEFIESLPQEEFSKLEEFFDKLPKLSKKIEVTCSKCGHVHTIDIEGLENFFV